MSATTFTNGVTLTDAAWFQDVDTVAYTLFGNGSSYTGVLTLAGTTNATSISTGQSKNAGGGSITKDFWVGGLANIAGAIAGSTSLKITTDSQAALNTVRNHFTNSNSDNANLMELQCGAAAKTTLFMSNSGAAIGDTITHIAFQYGTGPTAAGTLTSTGTTMALNNASDYRLKTNIKPLTGALDRVMATEPVTYDFLAGGSGEGWIAHELQAQIPLAVNGEKDAVDEEGKPKYQGVDPRSVVVVLNAAIRELNMKFEAYKEAHP